MTRDQISRLLTSITGNLQVSSATDKKSVDDLQQTLESVLLSQTTNPDATKRLTFANADFFASRLREKVSTDFKDRVVNKTDTQLGDNEMHVVVRDSPIRSTQIAGSMTKITAGARVTKTIGPLKDISGRDLFFDFIRIQKLIPLYIQGNAPPALLFKSTFLSKTRRPIGTKPSLTQQYSIDANTIWIAARIFDAAAPQDLYFGLRVKSGSLLLSAAPVFNGDKVTIAATTTATISLNLEQKVASLPAADDTYGLDATACELLLPETFNFSFTGNAKNIQEISALTCRIYGEQYTFSYNGNLPSGYNGILNRICFPIKCDLANFTVTDSKSPFLKLDGSAPITNAWWTVATATIYITKPLEADGNGGFLIACGKGILAEIRGMDGSLAFPAPFFIVEPGRIGVTELESNGSGYRHVLEAWRDEQRSFGTTIELKLLKKALFLYNSLSQGIEALSLIVDLDFKVDRPVKVNGEAVAVKSKTSILALSATKANKGIILYDDNILWDNNLPSTQIPVVKPYALAMHNALFTVTPPNGAVLLGEYEEGLKRVITGNVYLTFGLLSYLPTLPDPYAANLGALKSQFENRGRSQVWLWLVCRIQWENSGEVAGKVGLSFHFAPLKEQFTVLRASASAVDAAGAQIDGLDHSKLFYSNLEPSVAATDTYSTIGVEPDGGLQTFAASVFNRRQLPVGDQLNLEAFSLLDVSSKANQMGIAFTGTQQNFALMRRMGVELNSNREGGTLFPIQVSGLNVVTPGYNARAFTVPQVAWEPVLNVSPPAPNPAPSAEWPNPSNDPPLGWNYFPDDGFATRIGNSSAVPVTLSPIPMAKYLTQMYQHQTDGKTYAVFNLPFGMLAMTILNNQSGQINLPTISNVKPLFNKYIHGGIQLELAAGSSFKSGEDNLFQGLTFQLVNVLDMYGKFNNQSTLGSSVESIFNGEFSKAPANPQDTTRPGVPLTRIGLSGYGANAFSDWHNKGAAFAETSQATFNIVSGRTAHEVVQVKSVIYPWGIFVVRTITLFRLSNGYVGRVDSGWQAESDGKFYFGVRDSANPYEIHTGIVKGLYHIRNIRENELSHGGKTDIKDGDRIFDPNTNAEVVYNGPTYQETATLRGLTFDADFDIEDVTEGAGANNLVPAKQILGFVQLSPRGTAISSELFRSLLQSQNNSIGGAVNCTIKVAGTNQYMKLNRIDVNNSLDNVDAPIFVAAARGSVVLPKDGSWSMVTHQVSDGTVSPLTQSLSVPLIRIGKWAKDSLANPDDANNLLRIAHPAEILRLPGADTINFGFLQNLNTQKVLFLTPSFKTGFNSLLSKTPPLLADAHRLLNTKGIFPNIGNASDNLGAAIQLLTGTDDNGNPLQAFEKAADMAGDVLDAGKQVYEILSIDLKKEGDKLLDQGYKLIKQKGDEILNAAFKFDLPDLEYTLIDVTGLKIFVEYKASGSAGNFKGKLDYDVDSFANNMADQWKGRMNNLAMVVNLGPFDRLMTIKGNFNAQKGKESNFGSKETADGNTLPTPEIEFSDALEPVIKILEILSQLSQGNYKDALQKGLKVAMSNSANIWEYKYEATKDIPLVRFPLGALYESPQVPLKLEASMSLGVYFNAALKLTTDPSQLLPTAGAFFKFHGGLQVMCVTVGAGTIYAVGNVDLKLAADTSPLIALAMKFGFGAQIGVGLPVIGNVSVLFMVGVEIYVDSSQTIIVTAFMYFRGHAEILGGLIGVTITIEAKGSIIKPGSGAPTSCKASVSFGLDISIFLVIDISFHESWEETRQIA